MEGPVLVIPGTATESHRLAVSTRSLGYQPALDGVRAVAVLAVIGFHAVLLPLRGLLGVDIFFVLSGFLITVMLLQERRQTGTVSLSRFYLRRALRLLPALGALLLAFLGVSVLLYATDHLSRDRLVQNAKSSALGASYLSNVARAWFSPDPVVPALGHLWSLAMEEQFYLVWPIALLFLLCRVSGRRLLVIVGAASALVVAHRLQLVVAGRSEARLFLAPDTRFDAILMGCLAGIAYANGLIPRPLRTESGRRRVRLIAGWFVALALVTPVPKQVFYGGVLTLFEPAVALLLLAVLLSPDCGLARALKRPYLVPIGRISYGLYLWHPVLFASIGISAGLPATFVVAALSYRFVEKPFLRRKRNLSSSASVRVPDARPQAA